MIPPALRPRLAFAVKAFLNAAFVGVLVAGALRLQGRAHAQEEHRVELGRWRVRALPGWCSPEDVHRIRAASGLTDASGSLLDDQLLGRVRGSLAAAPQVERVVSLRRRLPDRVEVVLALRRPVAVVGVAGAGALHQPVDAEGYAVAMPTASPPARADGLLLRRIAADSPPALAPGTRFEEDVVAAAALAARLAELRAPGIERLDVVDVCNWAGRADAALSETVLRCSEPASGPTTAEQAGREVEWGRIGPRATRTQEPGFDHKAAHLVRALDRYPGLVGVARVRVAYADLFVVPDPPLTADPE